MKIKDGANIQGLDINMRPALIAAEKIWKNHGRPEGVTITCGLDGVHSAGSLHYYGRATDFRTAHPDGSWKFTESKRAIIGKQLRIALGANYDIIVHSTHIHAEYDPK